MDNQILQRIRDHFQNPRNQGEIIEPDLVLEAGSISEGDAVKLMLKFDSALRICEARFQSFGAAESIAALSVLTELLQGKTLEEAAEISEKDVLNQLWGIEDLPMFRVDRAVTLVKSARLEKRISSLPEVDTVR